MLQENVNNKSIDRWILAILKAVSALVLHLVINDSWKWPVNIINNTSPCIMGKPYPSHYRRGRPLTLSTLACWLHPCSLVRQRYLYLLLLSLVIPISPSDPRVPNASLEARTAAYQAAGTRSMRSFGMRNPGTAGALSLVAPRGFKFIVIIYTVGGDQRQIWW